MDNLEESIKFFVLIRYEYTDKSTLGKLYINGRFYCYTLEDTVRGYGIKINKQTAIPAGIYNLVLTYSNKFKRQMPLIEKVEGFTGVRMHGGNDPEDTEACVLVAFDRIGNSKIYKDASAGIIAHLEIADEEAKIIIINKSNLGDNK